MPECQIRKELSETTKAYCRFGILGFMWLLFISVLAVACYGISEVLFDRLFRTMAGSVLMTFLAFSCVIVSPGIAVFLWFKTIYDIRDYLQLRRTYIPWSKSLNALKQEREHTLSRIHTRDDSVPPYRARALPFPRPRGVENDTASESQYNEVSRLTEIDDEISVLEQRLANP